MHIYKKYYKMENKKKNVYKYTLFYYYISFIYHYFLIFFFFLMNFIYVVNNLLAVAVDHIPPHQH